MANAQRGNKILIDSTGQVTTSNTKVVHALFTPGSAGDEVVLSEAEGDADIFVIRASAAKNTLHFRFEVRPLLFPNGVYVSSISSGAKLSLITTTGGSD